AMCVVIRSVRNVLRAQIRSAESRSINSMTFSVSMLDATHSHGSIMQPAFAGKSRHRASPASAIDAAKRHQRVVEEGRPSGGIGCATLKECVEQPRDRFRGKVAGDDNDPGALVGVGPALEPHRRMHHVLDAVNYQGALGLLSDLHDALEAQELGTVQ